MYKIKSSRTACRRYFSATSTRDVEVGSRKSTTVTDVRTISDCVMRNGTGSWKLNDYDEEKMSFFEKYIFDKLKQIDAKQDYQEIGLILSTRIL